MAKTRQQHEYGDFQTPPELADEVCRLLSQRGVAPAAIIEPTCGQGNFLLGALTHFPQAKTALGCEINAAYLKALRLRLSERDSAPPIVLRQANFFETDWPAMLSGMPEPWLVIGNPPWVTNSELGCLASRNLPRKTNAARVAGIDALTGKSNFDVSEWMLLRMCEWLNGRSGTLAMLCKAAVARKVLRAAWVNHQQLVSAALYTLDAAAHFNAHVSACLLVCDFHPGANVQAADVYDGLHMTHSRQRIAWCEGQLVTNDEAFNRWRHLAADDSNEEHNWRSGIKHDCASVMELTPDGDSWLNRMGERIELESTCLYPLLKSSDLANGNTASPRHWMLVPQLTPSADTQHLREAAPQTWSYLSSHAELLDARRSSIYRRRPRFAVFGVGDYSFAPFKVAISAFYKRLQFQVAGSYGGRPIVMDDTVNFLACETQAEAERIADLLNSSVAREFYSAFVQWDAKRPITIDLLRRLDLRKLAAACEQLTSASHESR